MDKNIKKKRVVVTGMGIVSCFGTDVDTFYDSLLRGESGIRPLTQFPCEEYPTRFAGSVSNFETGDYLEKKQARRVDPFIRYAMVAGKKALEHAKLDKEALEKLDKTKAGIIIGSGMGGMNIFFEGSQTLHTKGYKRLTPFFVPYIITNMAGALLAMDIGFMGPNYSISTACATSNNSILAAAQHIQRGDADVMLCGGTEAPLSPIGLSGFVVIKALSERNDDPTKASRPFDKNRDGFVMGEGAGVIVLESLEHALARNATIYAEYLGGATTCDAYHMTDPRSDGLGVSLAIENALKDAQVSKDQINYINAHATSTPVGDLCELNAILSIFEGYIDQLTVNATKSMTGHCLGAAGAIETIAMICAILRGKVHPTINLDDPEEIAKGLDLVPHQAKDLKIKVGLNNSFGFGGHNCCLLFAPYKEARACYEQTGRG